VLPWINRVDTALAACDGADVLAVLTEWPEFSSVAVSDVSERLKNKAVVDGRNVLEPEVWKAHGFVYRGVGRN
jgi:UDPglucose 6-dehydrogenase